MDKKSVAVVDILLFSVVIIWAYNFTAVKLALAEFPPLGFNVLRFIASSLFFMIYYHFYIRDYTIVRKYFWRLLFLGFVGNTLLQIAFIFGLKFTSAGNASLMYSTFPMLVALLSSAFKFEKVNLFEWFGVFISFIGIVLVINSSASGLEVTSGNVVGDVLILCCALCWSVFTVFSKPLIQESSLSVVVSLTFITGTILLIPFGIYDFMTMGWPSISMESWGYFTFSFLFANVFAYTVWFYGVSKIGNVQTAIFQNMVPILAVIFAAIFLHESLGFYQILGGSCIIGGVTLTRLLSLKRKKQLKGSNDSKDS